MSLLWLGTAGIVGMDGSVSTGAYKAEGLKATNYMRTGVAEASVHQNSKTLLLSSVAAVIPAAERFSAQKQEQQQVQTEKQEGPTVYLTFDDGPSLRTKEVLAILKKENVVGTFFVLGKQVVENPDIARQIVEEGHGIGNHTYNHVYKELYNGFGEFAKQVIDTDEAIYKATGIRTRLVRAPGGTYSNFDKGYFDALQGAGYIVHDWNVDSGDSKRKAVPAAEIISKVKGSKLLDKNVVLMHDSLNHGESVKALPAIIAYYKEKGYSFGVLTNEVEPVHFKVADKLKWSRPKLSEQEAGMLKQYKETKQQKLIVHTEDKEIVFAQGDYKMEKGIMSVSLAELAIALDGRVEWDQEKGSAEVYTAQGLVFKMLLPEGSHGLIKSKRVMVPIRTTLPHFGMEISNYSFTEISNEIWTKKK